jgi:hypothetical protein
MAQRNLKHPDAELDALGHGGERRQRGQRIECRPTAAHRIPDPNTRKPAGLDAASVFGHAAQ